ncbi:MAG: FRG domain-containing protein [Lachnospiraceae bacterium]|nr:FRG domain-containing protein [Lachnospiraceae bacterium]
MFFFFFDENLSDNVIVQEAFHRQCFKKILETGYCDMNPFFGKPKIKREKIAYELEIRKSSLASLFKNNYPRSVEEATKKLGEVLEKLVWAEETIDNYIEFAIVYYVYKALSTNEKKEDFTRNILRAWIEQEQQSVNAEMYDMDLRISNGIIFDNNIVELHIVSTINQYIMLLDKVAESKDKLFFRGHSNVSYQLIPSVFRRQDWIENEKLMYQELLINCANDFNQIEGHLATLAEMQHYGLPTRLLDVTQNPLVALYFACEGADNNSGEVIAFRVRREDIKYPQSDTVTILASLPLFTYEEQKDFYEKSISYYGKVEDFNKDIERLVHEVRMERPGFVGKIQQEDLRKCIVVIPSKNNRRLEKQEGAFIVCGLLEEHYGNKKKNTIDEMRVRSKEGKKLVCIINGKDKILRQLNSLGINKSKVYPEIDDVADYIKNNINDL